MNARTCVFQKKAVNLRRFLIGLTKYTEYDFRQIGER